MKGDFVKWGFASVCVNANEFCLSVVQLSVRTQWRPRHHQMPPLREMVRNFEVQEQRVILLSKCYGAMREMRHSLIKPIHTHKYSSQMRGNTMREVGTWVDRSEWIDAPIEFM